MSGTAKLPPAETAPNAETMSSLLHDIVHRVDAIGAAQHRPSPVHLRSWEEIERFAEKAARSGMVPKDFVGKPDAICIAVQMGSELGLAPMQAVQNIAVVNGRPSIWGDAVPGLCRASGKCRGIREWSEGTGDDLTYYCEARRSDDQQPIMGKFSVGDAKRANLWKTEPRVKKQGRDGPYEVDSGPWYSYPERMLQMRARGFCLRDAFPDVLKGLITAEEAQDDIPFDATGLTPAPVTPKVEGPAFTAAILRAASAGRDVAPIIEPPPPTPRRTRAAFLDELESKMRECGSLPEVNRLIAHPDTRRAVETFTDGPHKARLGAIIASGVAAHAPVTHEGDDDREWEAGEAMDNPAGLRFE